MDLAKLKEAGKSLFKKNYWYSIVVAFLMSFAGTSSSTQFNFSSNINTSGSEASSFDSLFGNGEYAKTFSEEFFLFDKSFLEELVQRPLAVVFFIVFILIFVISIALTYLVFYSFRCGGIRYFLKSRKNQPVEIKEIFQNLKDKTNFNIGKVGFLKNISIIFWTVLFVIPGIIKTFEYWAIDYILAVRPDIDSAEAKRLSKILMDGNKWNCFALEFSFIGWRILAVLTAGLLNIFYVNPYMQATCVEFFSEIRLQALAKGKITPNDIPDYEVYNPFYQNPYDMPQNQPFAPPTYQQTWNKPYDPQQPIVEPVSEPIAQPIEPVVEDSDNMI